MVFIFLLKLCLNFLKANSGDHDQMSCFAVSGLGLHCLPISHKKDIYYIFFFKDIYHKNLRQKRPTIGLPMGHMQMDSVTVDWHLAVSGQGLLEQGFATTSQVEPL